MTIRIHEETPRSPKRITLDFADGSSITGVLTESSFELKGPNMWRMEFRAELREVELRAPFQERLGLLDSGSLAFTPLQDGYVVETS